MARRKKPENETPEEATLRQTLETVSNSANRSEKTSWNRKMDNMVKLLTELKPIEDKILKIIAEEKTPMLDKVGALRDTMVKECVHPYEYLVMFDKHIECKFCNKRMNIPANDAKT